jgi:hypothetical protein
VSINYSDDYEDNTDSADTQAPPWDGSNPNHNDLRM